MHIENNANVTVLIAKNSGSSGPLYLKTDMSMEMEELQDRKRAILNRLMLFPSIFRMGCKIEDWAKIKW